MSDDLSPRQLERKIDEAERECVHRVSALEADFKEIIATVKTEMAVAGEIVQGVIKSVDKVNGSIEKLTWAIVLAVVGAGMKFLLHGGP